MKKIKFNFIKYIVGIVATLLMLFVAYFKGKSNARNEINIKSFKTIKKSKKDYEKAKNDGAVVAREWLRKKRTK